MGFWDENVRKGTWDGGPIDPSVKEWHKETKREDYRVYLMVRKLDEMRRNFKTASYEDEAE